jgi:hypothetical protein
MNPYAYQLFESEKFALSDNKKTIELVDYSITELGFSNKVTTEQMKERINTLGLSFCPLEVAPYLRISLIHQEEKQEITKYEAPPGSLTVLSEPLFPENPQFPKGFYLRKIEGELWLRGYIADDSHKWNLEDRFVLMKR